MEFIPISQPSVGPREREYLIKAFDSGWISSLGAYIDEFEREFARRTGTKFAIAVSNGTVALHLALEGLGAGAGDEVIVPDLTFIATANTVVHAGATPILVDVDPRTGCISPEAIEVAITPRTKVIMPVHLYGHPAEMARIVAIAKKHNLLVVEDAAEAQGADIGGQIVGSFGDCATFSFYGNKLMTTGEGGMVTTNDEKLATKMRRLRDHAMSPQKRYWHTEVGFNYRITNLQAAVGVGQLERIDELLSLKRGIFARYEKNLAGVASLKLNQTLAGYRSSYWMVCVSHERWEDSSRNTFMAELKKQNVDSRPFFYPLSDMGIFLPPRQPTPVTHRLSQSGLNIPSFVGMTDEQIDYVSDVIRGLAGKLA